MSFCSDESALLGTILDQPDDDVPRLVYADWLDEHGDADRARFIRLQCAADELPYGPELRTWSGRSTTCCAATASAGWPPSACAARPGSGAVSWRS
jgi:uncharacterized protein (TIGR02996 family)